MLSNYQKTIDFYNISIACDKKLVSNFSNFSDEKSLCFIMKTCDFI